MPHATALLRCLACAALTLAAATTHAVGWDDDDFIVAGARLTVYDHDFTFKGYLDDEFFRPNGLDFDPQGRLVAATRFPVGEVRVYESSGQFLNGPSFVNPDLGGVLDIKVGDDGRYYAGTILDGLSAVPRDVIGLVEFGQDGSTGREFQGLVQGGRNGPGYGPKPYSSVAILPDGVVWSGVGASVYAAPPAVDAFNTDDGTHIAGIFLDNGQQVAISMRYSATSNTVLMTDPEIGGIERDLDGSFLRSFQDPERSGEIAITRGPNDDVFIAAYSDLMVTRFSSDGTLLGRFEIPEAGPEVINILWAGNAPSALVGDISHIGTLPEPTTLVLAATGLALAALRRHGSTVARSR